MADYIYIYSLSAQMKVCHIQTAPKHMDDYGTHPSTKV